MSSRVEEQNAQQAAEAERLQKKIDRDVRDQKAGSTSRETFAKLVKGNDHQARAATQKEAANKEASSRAQGHTQGGAKTQQQAERAALNARNGLAQATKAMETARGYQGGLERAQTGTAQQDQGRVERRETGKGNDRVVHDDRNAEVVEKAERRRDQDQADLSALAREGARPNAAIGSDGNGDASSDGGGHKRRGNESAAALAGATAAAAPEAAGPVAHTVKQIPPELLEKLVSSVYLAVNQKGLKEFQIELKDGPLKGATLRVSAQDGKVALTFTGLGGNEKRLVESSKGELMRRLEKKGLRLASLDVK